MCHPTHVLRVRAIENTRTAADDEKEDNEKESDAEIDGVNWVAIG